MPLRDVSVLCHVVDNFGDAGVCWRLARQLALEHGLRVGLWIDQPAVLGRFLPHWRLDQVQSFAGGGQLTIRRWPADEDPQAGAAFGGATPLPDLLVSAFGCEPPEAWRTRLAGAAARPLWVNLEYLSAEAWVDACHGLDAIKPSDGARQVFFFPGFRPTTGGLLREADLLARRDVFRRDRKAAWLRQLGLPDAPMRTVSVFCYPQAPLASLLSAIAAQPTATRVLLADGIGRSLPEPRLGGEPLGQEELGHEPLGTARPGPAQPGHEQPAPWSPGHRTPGTIGPAASGARWLGQQGSLSVWQLPALPFDDFDRLLWACELNLVRGEDSWIRALWAGRPLVWQPYRQADDAHEPKRLAYQQWQRAHLPDARPEAVAALDRFSAAWSAGASMDDPWQDLACHLQALQSPFDRLSRDLANARDLATSLVEFCRSRL